MTEIQVDFPAEPEQMIARLIDLGFGRYADDGVWDSYHTADLIRGSVRVNLVWDEWRYEDDGRVWARLYADHRGAFDKLAKCPIQLPMPSSSDEFDALIRALDCLESDAAREWSADFLWMPPWVCREYDGLPTLVDAIRRGDRTKR